MSTPSSELGSFDDRYTMRFVRILRSPIERVWEAVTRAEQLDVWLMPVCEIEPRLGGRCRFSWGAPGDTAEDGSVLVFEPPHRVRYGNADAAIEFQLEPVPEGTRFTFLQLFSTRFRPEAMDDRPGGGLPAGPDTPWRPGFVAGFHLTFDELGRFLAGSWSEERIAAESARLVGLANTGGGHLEDEADEPWRRLVEIYTEHIREQCPRSGGARLDAETGA